MIHKVTLYFILPMCLIAFFLSVIGVQQVELGESYYSFLGNVASRFESWKLTIPDIPKVPSIDKSTGNNDSNFLKAIASILNFFVLVINAIVTVLNIFISIINIVIQMVQFILTLIYSVRDFINGFRDSVRFAYV